MLCFFMFLFKSSGTIRIVIPPLTEERRKELAKQAKSIGEDGKVAIRNIRRDGVDKIKKVEKEISKDQSQEYQVVRLPSLCCAIFTANFE